MIPPTQRAGQKRSPVHIKPLNPEWVVRVKLEDGLVQVGVHHGDVVAILHVASRPPQDRVYDAWVDAVPPERGRSGLSKVMEADIGGELGLELLE